MDLSAQRSLVLSWLASAEARSTAEALVRRHSDGSFIADDLLHDAWIRLDSVFERRVTAYPHLADSVGIARFCTRVLDNLARDRMRSVRRRREVALVDFDLPRLEPMVLGVEERVLLHRLVEVIGRVRVDDVSCQGCSSEVVVATALEIVHLVLSGDEGAETGRTWMDRLMHAALDRVVGDDGLSYEARTQRKSRCGRCVVELLSRSMHQLMEDDHG